MSLSQTRINHFFRSKIFLRQFGTTFSLIVGFSIAFSAAIGLRTRDELKLRQAVIAEHNRNQTEAALREWMDSRINAMRAVAAMLGGETPNFLAGPIASKKLAGIVAAHPDFVEILLIDSTGLVVNGSVPREVPNPIIVSDREYFMEAMETGVGITGFFQARRIGLPFMSVAARIRTSDGSNAVAVAFITPDRFRAMLNMLNSGGPGSVYLVGKDGLPLLSETPAPSGTGAQAAAWKGNPAAAAAARGERGVLTYRTAGGENATGAYAWIEEIQAGLVVELDDELLMKPLERLQGFVTIMAAICILLALFASALLSARIFKPVRELIRAMDEVAASDYSRNVELVTGDELDALIERFNRMRRLIAKRESILKDDASRDSLTGLYNHSAITEYLDRAARSGGGVCFAMVDLDHFKLINDELGHKAGDYVLTRLAELLKRTVRAGDFVGRYGGEEFAVVLRAGDEAAFCERLRVAIERTDFIYEGKRIPVTASVGWACSDAGPPPEVEHPGDEIVNAADAALYRAKAAGRNRVERG